MSRMRIFSIGSWPWSSPRCVTGFRLSGKAMWFDVSDEEMEKRRAAWQMPPYKAQRGTLYKYINNVKNASLGCVTDE